MTLLGRFLTLGKEYFCGIIVMVCTSPILRFFISEDKDLSVEDELDVQAGAEKRKITAAFRKMNKGKKSNKFMTKEFISQIA